MKHFLYIAAAVLTGSLINWVSLERPAQAQVAYGSYVGIGPTVGLSDGGQIGGTVAARYKLLKSPISFRAQALIAENIAVVPTVSYDIPLNWQTDAYVGAGLALAGGDTPSPVGNKVSFAVQPGVDYAGTEQQYCDFW